MSTLIPGLRVLGERNSDRLVVRLYRQKEKEG